MAYAVRPWEALVGQLLAQVAALTPSGGMNYVRLFLRYILSTQERPAQATLHAALRQHAPDVGDTLMTYAQELLREGREGGAILAEVRIIENLLQEGMTWAAIARVTGITEAQCQALKQRADALHR